jgi:ABC-type transporter Mla subunit MlaD
MANEKLIVELSAQIQGLKTGLDNASKEIGKFNTNTNNAAKNTEKDFNAIGSAAAKVGGIVAGAFAVGSIVSFGKGRL